jgi:hypothetical protein
VDNAIVASAISESAGRSESMRGAEGSAELATVGTGRGSEEPQHGSSEGVLHSGGLSSSMDRSAANDIDADANKGSANLASLGGNFGDAAVRDVAVEVKKVERRRAAEARTFEGMRRPRHKRMAAKRASHAVKPGN